MEIDDSSALVHYTYYMMNWEGVSQYQSATRCLSCGGAMMSVESVRDKKGVVFEGLVCHKCKTLLWNRKS
jgi:uncharacterized protein with PIN domain